LSIGRYAVNDGYCAYGRNSTGVNICNLSEHNNYLYTYFTLNAKRRCLPATYKEEVTYEITFSY